MNAHNLNYTIMEQQVKTAVPNRSKLGRIIDEKGLSRREVADALLVQFGYYINTTNMGAYCTGVKVLRNVRYLKMFAQVLGVTIEDLVD